ncbi:polysaccharide pyruvyl transferase family protein [Faecalicatena fissicatena]|uniref:polysaccharide pyruvyl transferase family protein n=1 Tax=Faecalicatena fissicatena TaxID=290055 RepID=UPI00157029F7|nr:polysaccharide pyruvyl transferase family protein [Faecalicatena fissicatena]NSE33124.1 polysaccharide pyruvyl transferase family protein [Faecalicatena fissicatena]
MKKKIGIITFHTALNYGAVLQTYALQNFIKKNGVDNEIIDYKCKFIEKCYKPFFISDGKIVNSLVRGILFGSTIRKKRRVFDRFLNERLELSKEIHTKSELQEIAEKYEYCITGSDQVWSPISAGFDEMYFLPGLDKRRKFSYAASIGATDVSEEIKQQLKQRLADYSVISVREESAKKLLKQLDNTKKIEVHVDPTLLLNIEEWKKLVGEDMVKQKYLLIFNVEKPIQDIEYAKKIAKIQGLKIIYINERTIRKDPEITYYKTLSPEQFLTLFYYADVVVTNSFHGTVFSIIFNKCFYVELENKRQRNIRVEGLLEKLEIKNREIDMEKMNYEMPNWNRVNEILNQERKRTLSYLQMIHSIALND